MASRSAGFLLDTNILSEVGRPQGNPQLKAWLDTVSGADLYISVLVVGEIRQGIERLRRRDPAQAAVYERWLDTLKRDYADRIMPITVEVAQEWGRLNASRTLPTVDSLMAATARVHGLILVTRNTSDLRDTGVSMLNPFGGEDR